MLEANFCWGLQISLKQTNANYREHFNLLCTKKKPSKNILLLQIFNVILAGEFVGLQLRFCEWSYSFFGLRPLAQFEFLVSLNLFDPQLLEATFILVYINHAALYSQRFFIMWYECGIASEEYHMFSSKLLFVACRYLLKCTVLMFKWHFFLPKESNGPTDCYAAISQVDRLQSEPESIRKWREEQKERLEQLGKETVCCSGILDWNSEVAVSSAGELFKQWPLALWSSTCCLSSQPTG